MTLETQSTNTAFDKPVARKLLMKLLGSRDGIKMDAASAVRVGALFGISENNIRVTLTRLQGANLLQLVERGFYTLGEEGEQFATDIGGWRVAEETLCSWSGDWIAVLTNSLAKSDRKAQRSQERALKLMGMRQLSDDLYIRPSNFTQGVGAVRKRLYGLGLNRSALVFNGSQFSQELTEKAVTLWQTDVLEASYQEGLQQLESALAQLPSMALAEAAKASYLVGDEALKRLVFDPLLPEPLVNVTLRKAFREKVKEYDRAGAEIWADFLQSGE